MASIRAGSVTVHAVLAVAVLILSLIAAGCTQPPSQETQRSKTAAESPAATPAPVREGPAAMRDPSPEPAAEAGPSPQPPPARPRLGKVRLRLERIAVLNEPTSFAARDGDPRIYLGEKAGRIFALAPGAQPRLWLDNSRRTWSGGERGQLGLAFSPDGSRLYVSYIGKDLDSHVDEYEVGLAGPDVGSRREVLFVEQPDEPEKSTHKGGNIAFGPDGLLYFGLGDGGPSDVPPETAQALDTHLGKLLRIDPTPLGDRPYQIPAGNPFTGRRRARPEIYALGLRNPWRWSFDTETGDLWLGDVGRYVWEEINVLAPEQLAGANFGWYHREGDRDFAGGGPPGMIEPLLTYAHGEGRCAVIAGHVYRGLAIPRLRGAFVYSDYCNGEIRALVRRRGELRDDRSLGVAAPTLSSFGEDADGELYVLTIDGGVYRLLPAP